MAALMHRAGGDVGRAARSVGLGLYIVGQIAKAHGGSVRAESTEEGGTTFAAVFPPSVPNLANAPSV